jgi:hypothetical protein
MIHRKSSNKRYRFAPWKDEYYAVRPDSYVMEKVVRECNKRGESFDLPEFKYYDIRRCYTVELAVRYFLPYDVLMDIIGHTGVSSFEYTWSRDYFEEVRVIDTMAFTFD